MADVLTEAREKNKKASPQIKMLTPYQLGIITLSNDRFFTWEGKMRRVIFQTWFCLTLLPALLLAACGPAPAPQATKPAPVSGSAVAAAPERTATPAPTDTPAPTQTVSTVTPYVLKPRPTYTPTQVPTTSCLDQAAIDKVVAQYLVTQGFPSLEAAKEDFRSQQPDNFGYHSISATETDPIELFVTKVRLVGIFTMTDPDISQPNTWHCLVIMVPNGNSKADSEILIIAVVADGQIGSKYYSLGLVVANSATFAKGGEWLEKMSGKDVQMGFPTFVSVYAKMSSPMNVIFLNNGDLKPMSDYLIKLERLGKSPEGIFSITEGYGRIKIGDYINLAQKTSPNFKGLIHEKIMLVD